MFCQAAVVTRFEVQPVELIPVPNCHTQSYQIAKRRQIVSHSNGSAAVVSELLC
jgi:hypothetical protein